MKVRFLQRDLLTEQVLPSGMVATVKERTNHIYGGPKSCEIEIRGNEKAMPELVDWLRNRIEIYDDQGVPLWWGIVERVEVPVGNVKLVADINEMANAIQLAYTLSNSKGESTGVPAKTPWIEDTESIEKYGRKELLLSIGESNAVAAEVQARIELQERAYPRIYPQKGGSSKEAVVVIRGMGEWETLGWQYALVPTKLALSYQTTGNGSGFDIQAPELKVAQSFRASTDFRLIELGLYLRKMGNPGEITVEVCEFVDEKTPGDSLGSIRIDPTQIGAEFGWVRGFLQDEMPMVAGKRYFLVMSCQWCDTSNSYRVALDPNKGYPGGSFRINVETGWLHHAADMPFRLNRNVQFDGHSTVTNLWKRLDALTSGYAQQITIEVSRTISEVGVYLRRVGDPGQLSIILCKDDAGSPGDQISTATIEAIEVGTSVGWRRALFDEAMPQLAGRYWLVLKAQQADSVNYYELQVDGGQSYSGGVALSMPTDAYIISSADMPFRTHHNVLRASYTTMTEAVLILNHEIQEVAQSFMVTRSTNLSKVQVFLKKFGDPGDLNVSVVKLDAEGFPEGGGLGSGSIEALDVGSSQNWYSVEISDYPQLTAFENYAVTFSASGLTPTDGYYLRVDGNGAYPGQRAFRKLNGNAWIQDGADMPFKTQHNQLSASYTTTTAQELVLDDQSPNYAQTFSAQSAVILTRVKIRIKKSGTPGDLQISVVSLGESALPDGENLASGSIEALDVSSNYEWFVVELGSNPLIPAGTKCAIVIAANDLSQNNNYRIQIDGNGAYAGHNAWVKRDDPPDWEALTSDIPFQTFGSVVGLTWGDEVNGSRKIGGEFAEVAQKIIPGVSSEITKLSLKVRKGGLPGDLTVSLFSDQFGIPGESLGSFSVDRRTIGSSYKWIEGWLSDQVPVLLGTPYWIVISSSGIDESNYYEVGVNNAGGYANGEIKLKLSGGWEALSIDIPFMIFGTAKGTSWENGITAIRRLGGLYASISQQIQVGETSEMVKIEIMARKVGNPSDLSVGIYTNSGGFPGLQLGSYTIDRRRIGTEWNWLSGWLNNQVNITAGNLYWIRVTANNVNDNNYYEIGVVNGGGYDPWLMKLEQSGEWTALAADIPFQVFEPQIGASFSTLGNVVANLGTDWPMMAMKVTSPTALALTSVGLYLSKVGQPGSVEIKVAKDFGGFPGETLAETKIDGNRIGTSYDWKIGALEEPVELGGNTPYWLVLSAAGASAISYYTLKLDGNAGYGGGNLVYKVGEPWTEGPGDMPFRLYANDMVETSQQIQNLLTAYGQFFTAVYVDPSSGILMESYRGGTTDAVSEIEKMLEIGTLDYVRLLARVNFDRSVEIWLQPVEKLLPWIEMKEDGGIYYRSGARVEEGFDPTGKWMSLEALLQGARFTNVVTGSQQVFVEAAKWDDKGNLDTTTSNWQNPYAKKVKIIDG